MDTCIYQVFYSESTKREIDPESLPFDNSTPKNPLLYEYGVIKELYEGKAFANVKLNGVLSWKFRRKTGWRVRELKDYCSRLSDTDIVTLNPFPELWQDNLNVWGQGERFCPGLIELAKDIYREADLDPDVLSTRMSIKDICYCNYWLANKKFLDLYYLYTTRVFHAAVNSEDLKERLFNGQQFRGAPMFPYLFERLFSTVLILYGNSFNITRLTPKDIQPE